MSIKKPTQKYLTELQDQVSRLRQYKRSFITMSEGKDTPFWKALKENLQTVIDANKALSDSVLDRSVITDVAGDYAIVKAYRASAKTAQDLILQVEKPEDYLDQLDVRIKILEARIEETSAQLQTTN